jgi:hypothetical protein
MTYIQVNASELIKFQIYPNETIMITVIVSSKRIFDEEVCIDYEASTYFSAKKCKMQIFASFRAPKIVLNQRIEKLGTLPLYSNIEFFLTLKNHENDGDYLILKPKNFPNFTDEMVEEILDLHKNWVDGKDICSPDFLELSEIVELNQMLKYFSKNYPLRFQNYIIKSKKLSTQSIQVYLDNLFSHGRRFFLFNQFRGEESY